MTTEETKSTVQGVQLPAKASQQSGFGEAWYFIRDGVLHADQGDQSAEGDSAKTMLRWDREDERVEIHEGLDVDELPTQFRNYAADGGPRD